MESKEFVKKFWGKYLWGNIFLMIIVVVLLCVGLKFGLDIYTHHGEGIQVPNLKGMQYEEARRLLEDDGLRIEVSDSGYNKLLPADCILAQTPGHIDKVKSGHVIYVTVNSPHSPMVALPDIIDNSSVREATAKLTAIGFRLLEPQLVRGEKDWVYGVVSRGRKLFAGDRVPVDVPLMLQIGDGKYDEGTGSVDYTDPDNTGGDQQDEFQEVSGPDDNGGSSSKESKSGTKSSKTDDSGLSDY
jgi:beta-lactam-binding protein with PASTA domain